MTTRSMARRAGAALLAIIVITLSAPAVAAGPAPGGPPHVLAIYRQSAVSAISALLSVGSEPGTICYELANVGFSGVDFSPLYATASVQSTMPPAEGLGMGLLTEGPVNRCVAGLEPAVVNHIFTSPQDFYLRIDVHDVLGAIPPDIIHGPAFAFAGSLCRVSAAPTGAAPFPVPSDAARVTVQPGLPFTLTGFEFVPRSAATITFTRPDDPSADVSFSQSIDDFGYFERVLPAGSLDAGFWWISASGVGCQVAPPPTDAGGAQSPSTGTLLPDTAMVSTRDGRPPSAAAFLLWLVVTTLALCQALLTRHVGAGPGTRSGSRM